MKSDNSVFIKRLTSRELYDNKGYIIQYIFESNKNCQFMKEYSIENAENKFDDLYKYSLENKAAVYGAFTIIEKKYLMIGFVWGYRFSYREDSNRMYVSVLHVKEEYRCKGIGNKLMESFEEEALAKGYDSVYLHVEGINEKGVHFYKKNGYITERIQLVKKLCK